MKRRWRGESGVRFVEEEKKKEDRASRAGEGESPWTRMRRTILHGGQRYRHLLQNMPPAPPLWERGGVYEAHGDIHRGVVIQGIQGTPKAFFSYPSTIFHRALVTLSTIITAIVIAILVVVPWSMIVLCRVGRYLTPAAESCQFRLEQPPLATRARATLIEQATQRGAAPS